MNLFGSEDCTGLGVHVHPIGSAVSIDLKDQRERGRKRRLRRLEPDVLLPPASIRPPLSPEAPPSPLSSRPELRRSVVERSAVADLSWKCFPTERTAVERSLCGCSFLENGVLAARR